MHFFILTTRPNANTNTNVFSSWKLDRPCVPPSRRPRPPARGSGSGWSGWRGFSHENASPTWHHCCVAVIVFLCCFCVPAFHLWWWCNGGDQESSTEVESKLMIRGFPGVEGTSWQFSFLSNSIKFQVLKGHLGNQHRLFPCILWINKKKWLKNWTWDLNCEPQSPGGLLSPVDEAEVDPGVVGSWGGDAQTEPCFVANYWESDDFGVIFLGVGVGIWMVFRGIWMVFLGICWVVFLNTSMVFGCTYQERWVIEGARFLGRPPATLLCRRWRSSRDNAIPTFEPEQTTYYLMFWLGFCLGN